MQSLPQTRLMKMHHSGESTEIRAAVNQDLLKAKQSLSEAYLLALSHPDIYSSAEQNAIFTIICAIAEIPNADLRDPLRFK